MADIKIICGCGATLEYSGEVMSAANRSRDFLHHHSGCLKFPELKLSETIDNVSDFEYALRTSIAEPLERIAKAAETTAIKLETIAESMPSRWQGGPR